MEKNYRAELIGLFGDPVDGNPIGVVEEAAFAARGLNYRYIITRVPPDDLEAAFRGIQAMGFRGANLTMPHKIHIFLLLDEIGVPRPSSAPSTPSSAATAAGSAKTATARALWPPF